VVYCGGEWYARFTLMAHGYCLPPSGIRKQSNCAPSTVQLQPYLVCNGKYQYHFRQTGAQANSKGGSKDAHMGSAP